MRCLVSIWWRCGCINININLVPKSVACTIERKGKTIPRGHGSSSGRKRRYSEAVGEI